MQQIVTVERVTKTRIIVSTGLAYRKDTGFEVGNTSRLSNGCLVPIPDDIKDRLESKELIWAICRTNWTSIPIEKLRQIQNILDS